MCDRCGKDHKEMFENALPEIALLKKAEAWIHEEDDEVTDALISDALMVWTLSLVRSQQDQFVGAQIQEGENPSRVIEKFARLMSEVSFLVGVQVADEYRNTISVEIPKQSTTEEERQEFADGEKKRMQEVRDLAVNPEMLLEAVKKTLEDLGLDPDAVMIADAKEAKELFANKTSESASEGGGEPPGMYL